MELIMNDGIGINATAGIYMIENLVNGKKYIGSTKNLKRRHWDHKYHLKAGTHSNSHLQRAYNFYGVKSFRFKVIEALEEKDCSKNEEFRELLARRESYWAEHYVTHDGNKGYNLAVIVKGASINAETRERMSVANRGENSYNAILSDLDVKDVCERIVSGEKLKDIAILYNVRSGTISAIKSGKRWTHITSKYVERMMNPCLSELQSIEICQFIEQGLTYVEISQRMNVTYDKVKKAGKGKRFAQSTAKYKKRETRNILTETQVVEICKLINIGKSTKELMSIFNVSKRTINDIKNGTNFSEIASKHLDVICYHPVLKESQVIEICELLNQNILGKIIAKRFNVSDATISMIKNRKIFQEVSNEYLDVRRYRSLIKESQVIEICELLSQNIKGAIIAKRFNLSNSTISEIKTGKIFQDISNVHLKKAS